MMTFWKFLGWTKKGADRNSKVYNHLRWTRWSSQHSDLHTSNLSFLVTTEKNFPAAIQQHPFAISQPSDQWFHHFIHQFRALRISCVPLEFINFLFMFYFDIFTGGCALFGSLIAERNQYRENEKKTIKTQENIDRSLSQPFLSSTIDHDYK